MTRIVPLSVDEARAQISLVNSAIIENGRATQAQMDELERLARFAYPAESGPQVAAVDSDTLTIRRPYR